MWAKQAVSILSAQKVYCREELFRIFANIKPDLTVSAFRWTIYQLQQEGLLYHTSFDAYTTAKPSELPTYKPLYSEQAFSVLKWMSAHFQSVSFVVCESSLLNEFLNHQIAQNTIFVQIEKDISSYVFDQIQSENKGNVLYKPSRRDFDRYWTRDCIVVLDLVSQSPLSSDVPHEITVEKMMVDLIAEKSIAATFSPAELPSIFEIMLKQYAVNRNKVKRYAGRRGKTEQIKKYLG